MWLLGLGLLGELLLEEPDELCVDAATFGGCERLQGHPYIRRDADVVGVFAGWVDTLASHGAIMVSRIMGKSIILYLNPM